jgi:2-oxoisovalerate dehydrogenase E2 component (dihydrolipoyl transacylase)
MADYVYKLPDIGEGITQAEIVKWHAAAGTHLAQDQPLVDVMTDKATVEITAPVSGVLRESHGKEGEKLAIGAVLAVFETEQDAETAEPGHPGRGTVAAPPAAAKPPATPSGRSGLAAPAVRARASSLGIDLRSVPGTGPDGRVVHADLDRLLLSRGKAAPTRVSGDVEEIPVSGLRRRIAERMQDSKRRIPHFTYVEEVEIDSLERERALLNSRSGSHITPLPLLIRALVRAIARHPEVNGHFDDAEGKIRRFRAVHVGIATQTERGLLVPVIRNAEARSIEEVAAEIHRLSSAARAGKSAPGDLAGSTITVTSLGALGGIMATPIINPPELAIIGINRIREKLICEEGRIETRKVMNLSSSFDHRIIDGFVAASFIATLREEIEGPRRTG